MSETVVVNEQLTRCPRCNARLFTDGPRCPWCGVEFVYVKKEHR